MGEVSDPLLGYRLRAVRIGLWVTVLTLSGMAGFAALRGHGSLNLPVFVLTLVAGAIACGIVAIVPWARLFESSLGEWAMYVWSAGDIALISVAIAANGGGHSDIWAVYALTTLFFAASYPARGQAALLVLTALAYGTALAATGWHITAAVLFLRFSCLGIVFLMAMFLARELRAEMEHHAETSLRAFVAEAEARRSEWFRSLVRDSSDIVTSFDEEGKILFISPAIKNFGYDPDDLVGTDVWDLVHPDDLQHAIDQVTAQFEGEREPSPIEYRAKTVDGEWRYIEGVATNLLDEATIKAIVVDARDVTDRKVAELLVASQSRVLEQIAAGRPLDEVLRLIATMVEEQTGAQCTIAMEAADDHRLVVVSNDPAAADGAGWSRPIQSSDGITQLGEVRLRFTGSRFATEADQRAADVGASLAAIAVERDFSKARLAHQARHDTLTGLPNRHVFVETLEEALTSARGHETLAVLFVDLDGFKEVNDTFGHHVGDQVLRVLGHRLAGSLRHHDVIARFGGDEFVALGRVQGPDHALQLADRILARVREPVSVESNRVTLDASIGITLAPLMEDDGPRWVVNAAWVQAAVYELLRAADAAMYVAKQQGGGRVHLDGDQNGTHPNTSRHLRAAGEEES